MSLFYQAPSASEDFSISPGVKQQTLPGSKAPPPSFSPDRRSNGVRRPFSFSGNRSMTVSDCRAGRESRLKYGTEATKTNDSGSRKQAKNRRRSKVFKVHEQEQQEFGIRERPGDQQEAEVLQEADGDPTN